MKSFAEEEHDHTVASIKHKVQKWARKHEATNSHARATTKLTRAMQMAFSNGVSLATVEEWLSEVEKEKR